MTLGLPPDSPAPPLLGGLLPPVWAEVVAVELVPPVVVLARPLRFGRLAPVVAPAVPVARVVSVVELAAVVPE